MRLASLAVVFSVTALAGFCSYGSLGCSNSTSSSSSSSGSSGTGCVDYSPPAGFDANSPTVSFATDVMPIFGNSCAFSTCHGSTTGSSNGIFLGKGNATKVHDAIVGKTGDENLTMPFVSAGDPRNSYLMRKMDASQCAIDAQCTGASCQASMPQNEESLPVETRDIVRRWIAQGAKND